MKTTQSKTPVQFQRSRRADRGVKVTSGRAGKVVTVAHIPVLRGDGLSGRVGVDCDLAEMPKPLLNGVVLNFQAWFVPKSAHPQFSSYDEFMASHNSTSITALGVADREPPEWAFVLEGTGSGGESPEQSDIYKTLGLHWPVGSNVQHDLIDAYSLIWNFRAAAHSIKIPRRPYASENYAQAKDFERAFWPTNRYSSVVSDYEQALITGELNLDVIAGRVPVSGIGVRGATPFSGGPDADIKETGASSDATYDSNTGASSTNVKIEEDPDNPGYPNIYGEMAGQNIGLSLGELDKMRQLQSFAKLKATYQGTDTTGFMSDDAIMADLMSGLRVPESHYRRPWLLDATSIPFGMVERHATDGASLEQSVTQGRATAMLSLNLPEQDAGGVIVVTVEVVPERIYERQSDEWLFCTTPTAFPDALRDVLRVEPVDPVLNRRVDARHDQPGGTYGFEPMNTVWQRDFTTLGGAFYQADPENPFKEQRSSLWTPNLVDPAFTADHYLVPSDFPHDVFSDTEADAFECVVRHEVAISGLTQFGDVLHEDNSEYSELAEYSPE